MKADEIGGPYVHAALLCDQVIEGKDGVLSIIRVVDRFVISASGTAPPDEMPPSTISMNIVVMLKSGFYKGRGNLRVVPISPSGKELTELKAGVLLEGDDRGVNVVLRVQMLMREEGLYWFDVRFEDQLLTRVPLRLVYQRVSRGLGPEQR